jgi:hypothetical protein
MELPSVDYGPLDDSRRGINKTMNIIIERVNKTMSLYKFEK